VASIEPIKYKTRVDKKTGKRVRYEVPRGEWRWQARWVDPDGEQRARNFRLKRDGLDFLERLGVSIQDGDYVDPKRKLERFDEWAAKWWKTTNQLAESTRRGYYDRLNKNVLPAFGRWKVVDIKYMDVEEFIADQFDNGYGWKTIADMVSILAMILDRPMRDGLRRDNPARGHTVKRNKKPITDRDVLDLPELLHLISYVPEEFRPVVWLLVVTGMRPSEMTGLQVRHVDFVRGVVSIERTLTPVQAYDGKPYQLVEGPPKTRAGYRKIGLPPDLVTLLSEMVKDRADAAGRPVNLDEPLFQRPAVRPLDYPNGRPLDHHWFRKQVMRPALRNAGLPLSVRTYDLRHSHASLLIALGATPAEVAFQMGHVDPSVSLRIYTHLFKGAQEALKEKMIAAVEAAEPARIARLRELPAVAGPPPRLSLEDRRERVEELQTRGFSRMRIALELGASWQTIDRDVKALAECNRNASECKKTGSQRVSRGQRGSGRKVV
jgi:integrase